MAKSRFVYQGNKRTVEDVSRRAKHSSGLYDSIFLDGFATYKPKEGENQIRILPLTWKDLDKWGTSWEIMIFTHGNIGPDRGAFLCLNHMQDEPCPICEARREAVDDEERDAFRPSERALVWLVDRNDQKAGPQLWSMPIKTVFKAINAKSTEKKTGALLLIDDPEEGYDIFFNVDGAGKKTASYTGVELDRDPTPLHDNEATQDKWLEYITENPLPDILNIPDPEYIQKVMSGRVARKSEDEGDERPRGRRRPAAEEEEEPTPRRTTRRRPSEEAEEEEFPHEQSATDPRPRRTSRSRSEPEEEGEPEAPSGRTGRRSSREPDPEEEEVAEKETRPAGRREEEHDPDTGELPARKTTRRRAEPEEEAEDEPPPESKRARAGLEKLRTGRGK